MLERVENVTFHYNVNSRIIRGWWPVRTSFVKHLLSGSTDWPENLKTLHYTLGRDEYHPPLFKAFPKSLTALDLHYAGHRMDRWGRGSMFRVNYQKFAETLPGLDHLVNLTELGLGCNSEHRDPLPSLPPSLQVLRIGSLIRPIKSASLPASLREIVTGDIKFSITDDPLPDTLTHLTIGAVRRHGYMQWSFPRSLRYLKMIVCEEEEAPVDGFNAFVASLPDSLEVLHLTHLMSTVKVDKWPASLRELHLEMNMTISEVVCIDGANVEKLYTIENTLEFAPLPCTFETLHITNKRQEFPHDWRFIAREPERISQLHVYRFSSGQSRITLDCFEDGTFELHRFPQ
jgi:hypothetical protein